MRAILALTLLAGAGCSNFFTPPCTRVARQICDVGSEGDSCAFVLGVARNDDRAQSVCDAIYPAAQNLKAQPYEPTVVASWTEARHQLEGLGMAVDPLKGRIDNKLKAAGGEAGRMVQKLEDANAKEEQRVNDAAKAIEQMGH